MQSLQIRSDAVEPDASRAFTGIEELYADLPGLAADGVRDAQRYPCRRGSQEENSASTLLLHCFSLKSQLSRALRT